MRKRFTSLLLCVLLLSGCQPTKHQNPNLIKIGGSSSVSPVMELLVEAFEAKYPHIKIELSATGSKDGITGTYEHTLDMGMSSRELTIEERGLGLKRQTVAIDAIAMIVHPTNPVSDMNIDQIRDIYEGKITSWEAVGGVNAKIGVVSREASSGTRGAFEQLVHSTSLVKGSVELDSTGKVMTEISKNDAAIGYISLGSLKPEVKALTLNGVIASSANVLEGHYALTRAFILVYDEAYKTEAMTLFLSFIQSAEAHALINTKWIAPIGASL